MSQGERVAGGRQRLGPTHGDRRGAGQEQEQVRTFERQGEPERLDVEAPRTVQITGPQRQVMNAGGADVDAHGTLSCPDGRGAVAALVASSPTDPEESAVIATDERPSVVADALGPLAQLADAGLEVPVLGGGTVRHVNLDVAASAPAC